MCHFAGDKRCAYFSLKMHQMHLAAGLRLDPLGELSAPQTPSLIQGLEVQERGKEQT